LSEGGGTDDGMSRQQCHGIPSRRDFSSHDTAVMSPSDNSDLPRRPRFLRLGRSVRYLPSDVADFVRASAVDTTSVSTSDDESEIGELRV
jgi:hypothetical protein